MIIIDDIEPRVIYTIADLCHYTGMSYYTIRYHVSKGNIKSYRLSGGRQIRIKGKHFLEWVIGRAEKRI